MNIGRIETVGKSGPRVIFDADEAQIQARPESGPQSISWPEPLKEQAFHGTIGDLARIIEPHTESDIAAILTQSLVVFGNIIGRGSYFQVEADQHPGNLFLVLTGETGKGRKGTSLSHVLRPFREVDETWAKARIAGGLSSGEGVIWHVRDAIEKQEPRRENHRVAGYESVIVDQGVSDKRVLILEPEFASPLKVMSREGNTLSPVLRQCWDGRPLQILTKNSSAVATGAHASIIGHITRMELRRELTSTDRGNGFGNRVLWVMVRRSKILPDGGQLDQMDFTPIISRIKQAANFAQTAGEIKRDEAARRMWRAVYEQLSEGKPGLLGAVTGRAEAQVTRLSLLYALLDCSRVIRAEHLEAGLAVWDFAEQSAKYIFGDSLGHPEADTILQALKCDPEGLTRAEISALFSRHRTTGEINAALENIEGLGRATRFVEKTGGRPIERWRAVNGHA